MTKWFLPILTTYTNAGQKLHLSLSSSQFTQNGMLQKAYHQRWMDPTGYIAARGHRATDERTTDGTRPTAERGMQGLWLGSSPDSIHDLSIPCEQSLKALEPKEGSNHSESPSVESSLP